MLANTMLCLAHFAVNPLVPSYATHLGAQGTLMGLLTGMFFGVALAMRPISGPMITKIDKRKLLIGVFVLGAIANFGYAMFPTISLFVVFRFINGAQYSFVGSLILTRVSDCLPPEKMASGMGIYGVGGSVAMSIAPAIGEFLVRKGTEMRDISLGYRMLFFYAMTILILATIPCFISDPDNRSKEDADSVGKWYRNIFTMRAAPIALIMLFLVAAYSMYNNYMIKFGQEVGVGNIGLFYTVLAFSLMLSRPLMGSLLDNIGGGRKGILPALALFAGSFLIVGTAKSMPQMLVGAVVAAIGYGAAQPTLQALCMRVVPPLKRGVASNTLYVGIDLGFFIGPIVGAAIQERTGSFGTMYKFTVVPVVIAGILLFFLLPAFQRRIEEIEGVK